MNTQEAVEYTIKVMNSPETMVPANMTHIKDTVVTKLKEGGFLNYTHRKAIALSLFAYAMVIGVEAFPFVLDAVMELGVEVEYKECTGGDAMDEFLDSLMTRTIKL